MFTHSADLPSAPGRRTRRGRIDAAFKIPGPAHRHLVQHTQSHLSSSQSHLPSSQTHLPSSQTPGPAHRHLALLQALHCHGFPALLAETLH